MDRRKVFSALGLGALFPFMKAEASPVPSGSGIKCIFKAVIVKYNMSLYPQLVNGIYEPYLKNSEAVIGEAIIENCPFVPSDNLIVGNFQLSLVKFENGCYVVNLGGLVARNMDDAKEKIEKNFMSNLKWNWKTSESK